MWTNWGILGECGAIWLLASSGRHFAVLLHSEEWEWLRAPVILEWEKNWSEMGCHRMKQWRNRKNSLGSFVRHGEVELQCGRIDHGAVTLIVEMHKVCDKTA